MSADDKKSDDQRLFREAMGDIEPLQQDRTSPYRKRRRPEPLNLPVGDEADDVLGDLNVETPEFLDFVRPGVQKRVYRDLQRGVIVPEGTLDLHGMRVNDARRAFSRFLTQSRNAGRRCIRIIHGKGRSSCSSQPVLKQKTNQWLQQSPEILAFCAAPRWDGGTGAAYVLLSRKARLEP